MLKAALLVLSMTFAVSNSAMADTLTLSGTLVNTGVFAGTVNFNATTGVYTGADFDAVEGSTTYLFDSSPASQYGTVRGAYVGEFLDGLGDTFYLDFPGTNLIGYTGGSVCSQQYLCSGTTGPIGGELIVDSGDAFAIQDGLAMLTLGEAPEPPSFLLVMTGVFGILAGVWYKRRTTARLDPAACTCYL